MKLVRPEKPIGWKDTALLLFLAVGLAAGGIFLTVRVIDQSEQHLQDVKDTRVSSPTETFTHKKLESEADQFTRKQIESQLALTKLIIDNPDVTDRGIEGIARMQQLEDLSLNYTRITDAGLAHLVGLPLRNLSLMETNIGDEGMKHLAQIKTLEFVNLLSTGVTDRGLVYLRSLENLSDIHLASTHVTDKGMEELAHHRRLWKVSLMNTNVTDASLPALAKLPELSNLIIDGTDCTVDGAINAFASHKHLRKLSMENCKVDDQAVDKLCRKLPNLIYLNLSGTAITDRGLMRLISMDALKRVRILRCKGISAGAIERFKKSKPGCRVETI